MREKVLMLFTALVVFGLLSHHALETANRNGEKRSCFFLFSDFSLENVQ